MNELVSDLGIDRPCRRNVVIAISHATGSELGKSTAIKRARAESD
jgi:hypothetical protein